MSFFKMKTTKAGLFRLSTFSDVQLSALNHHQYKDKKNLSLILLYYVEEKQLISVDMGSIVSAMFDYSVNKVPVIDGPRDRILNN